jgi:carbon-monoxide dehydrogenase medium subunit
LPGYPSGTELGGGNHHQSQTADEVLRGKPIDEAALIEMDEVAAAEVDPVDDNRGSAEYKREMVSVFTRRALRAAAARARGVEPAVRYEHAIVA